MGCYFRINAYPYAISFPFRIIRENRVETYYQLDQQGL